MILKIVYGDSTAKYFLNVQEIDFTSHLNDSAYAFSTTKDKPNDGVRLFCSAEFIDREAGCSKDADDLDAVWANRISLKHNNMVEEVAYTGHAYLCDDSGKTVDTLR